MVQLHGVPHRALLGRHDSDVHSSPMSQRWHFPGRCVEPLQLLIGGVSAAEAAVLQLQWLPIQLSDTGAND